MARSRRYDALYRVVAFVCLLFVALSCSKADVAQRLPRNPNILIIVLDTVRADHLGCYGYSRNTSPNLDAFAAENAMFKAAYSTATSTPPAHFALFTGIAHGRATQKASERSIVNVLRKHGYYTVGISANNNVSPKTMHAVEMFEDFAERDYTIAKPEVAAARPLSREEQELFESYNALPTAFNRYHLSIAAENMNELIFARLRGYAAKRDSGASDAPLFMFINYLDPHDPYFPREPYRSQFDSGVESAFNGDLRNRAMDQYKGTPLYEDLVRWVLFPWMINCDLGPNDLARLNDLYDAEIAYLDHHVGKLFEELKRLGLYENTAIFIVADHGELLGEHHLFSHSHYEYYEELIHIPLIARIPGDHPRGQTFGEVALITDIRPTILEMLGIERADKEKSTSLLTLLVKGRDDGNRVLISRRFDNVVNSLASAQESVGEFLKGQFFPETDEREETKERLKALGYLE